MKTDAQLLREFADSRDEGAFTELVNRHLGMVYSAACRETDHDLSLAEDITQLVFVELARKAGKLTRHPAIAGWLYVSARHVSANLRRTEQRRHTREQEANTMNELIHEPSIDAAWRALRPVIDDALHELNEPDRECLLLRFFEGKNLREIGELLSLTENASRMRVERALDKLRKLLARRGVTSTGSALAATLAVGVVPAPSALAAAVTHSALMTAGAGVSGTVISGIMTTTKAKLAVISVITAGALGTAIYEIREAAQARDEVSSLQRQQVALSGKLQQAEADHAGFSNQLALLRAENQRLNGDASELRKLRGEMAQLRVGQASSGPAGQPDYLTDPFTKAILDLAAAAGQLNQQLQARPETRIPELQFLTENDWLEAVRGADLKSDAGVRKALSKLRSLAKHKVAPVLAHALDGYLKSTHGEFPAEISQLKPFFEQPIDDALLARYELLHTGHMTNTSPFTWVIGEKAPVDRDYDSHLYAGPNGRSTVWATGLGEAGDPDEGWATR